MVDIKKTEADIGLRSLGLHRHQKQLLNLLIQTDHLFTKVDFI